LSVDTLAVDVFAVADPEAVALFVEFVDEEFALVVGLGVAVVGAF